MKKSTRSGIMNRYPNQFVYPALFIYSVFFLTPVVAALILGFTDWNIERLFNPKFIGIDNFIYLVLDEYFMLALKNTFIFALITTSLKVLIGLVLALGVTNELKSRNFLRMVFYMPAVLSMVIIGVIFQAILKMDGILNHILLSLGLDNLVMDWLGNPKTALYCAVSAEIWKWSGFTMAIFIAGIQSISREYYEAAKIDGASSRQSFFTITLPLLQPAFNIAIVMNVIGGLKVFEQVYVLTAGGPGFSSQVLGTYIFTAFSEGRLGRSTAMGLILFFIVYIISGSINLRNKKREVSLS